MTSREFNQDTSGAKKAARKEPVFITCRGKASHVLLSIAEYRKMANTKQKIADLLTLPGVEDIDIEITKSDEVAKAEDFS